MPYPDHSDHPKFLLAVVTVTDLVVCSWVAVAGGTFAAVVVGILTAVVGVFVLVGASVVVAFVVVGASVVVGFSVVAGAFVLVGGVCGT